MGLLTVATPMQWAEAKKYADHVREHGIKQFINIYYNLRDRHNDSLKFGEEVCVRFMVELLSVAVFSSLHYVRIS
jgi:hypothetical protein